MSKEEFGKGSNTVYSSSACVGIVAFDVQQRLPFGNLGSNSFENVASLEP